MEGFGSPVLEGFAAGIPVVSSNTTSIPEIAEDAAILVDPYDIFEIAQGVTKILANKTLEERLVIKGKRIVWKYNWERAANEYIDLYKFSSNSGK
jgi:alpha-1,3-rhamnosyl/mannosyltransferase